jgi:hypothetical protein
MSTTTPSESGQNLLAEMAKIPVIIPGKLCPRRGAGGKTNGWKLQRWHNGHNQTRYIPTELVVKVKEGTAGHQRFMSLAQEYVEIRGQEAMRAIRSVPDSKKKPMRR